MHEGGVMVGLGITISLLEDGEVPFILNELRMIGFDCVITLLKFSPMVSFSTYELNLMQ